jgi:hypothetical protein
MTAEGRAAGGAWGVEAELEEEVQYFASKILVNLLPT